MEIIFIVLSIITGIFTGVITGLIPGIHVNTIAALMVSVSTFLYGFGMDNVSIAVFISAVAITHAFFDYIPSLFLGVPSDEVFALLPGHRMVKDGRGIEALNLSIGGSWNGVKLGVSVLLIFLALNFLGIDVLGSLDDKINPYLFWILIIISLVLIITEENKIGAAFIFILSGLYGLIVLGSPLVPGSNAAFSSLFPALAGIFGVSGIIFSLFEKIDEMPEQKEIDKIPVSRKGMIMGSFRGGTAGMAVGLLPGLGGANAATLLLLIENFIGRKKKKDNSDYTYIVTTSAINTTDAMFAIAALYFIEKSRSGASVAIDHLFQGTFDTYALIAVIITIIISAFISVIIMKKQSIYIARFLAGLNYKALSLSILIFLSILVYLTTGIWGFIVMVGGAMLGMTAPLLKVRRAQAMGFFIIPVILFYSGYQRVFSTTFYLEAKTMIPVELSIISIAFYLLVSIGAAILIYNSAKLFINKI